MLELQFSKWAACLVAAGLLVGCSSSDNPAASSGDAGAGGTTGQTNSATTGGGGGAGGTAGAGGGSSSDALVGGFDVRLVAADEATGTEAFTAVSGRVDDGPRPPAVVMRVVDEANGCRLRTPRIPFCSPACGSAAACTDDNKCDRYPAAQNLGPVRVTGLGGAEFSMDPIQGSYQPPGDVMLPNPPCPEGADVSVHTSGGAYDPFVLEGKGISPLILAGSGTIPLSRTDPLRLEWTPPGNAALTRMQIRIDISHHGGLKGDIECDEPDTGSIEIPATLVAKLIDLGTAGFPTVYVSRVSSSFVAIRPGRVTLNVSSSVERSLAVPGIVSCNDNSECPPGKTCQTDRTCK